MASRRVVITGLGIVSPLGVGVNRSWDNLINGISGITLIKGPGYDNLPCKVAAYVPEDQLQLEGKFSPAEVRKMSTSTLYALIAADEAIKSSQLNLETVDRSRIGVTIGNGMCNVDDIYEQVKVFKDRGYNRFNPHFLTRILINMPAGFVSIHFGLKGPNHCVSTACTTGLHALGDGFNFIQKGSADVMISGGTEAVIGPSSVAAFSRIRALTCDFNDSPSRASRPFDAHRSGFVMGEGAGLMVIEELNHAKNRGATIYGEILGYGLSGDAFHITSPPDDGSGAHDCMRSALIDASIDPSEINHINCHATSTPQGDIAELTAIKRLFGPHANQIAITSTKGATGHLLGAAGSVEAIFTCLAVNKGLIPPTINLDNPIDTELNLVANKSIKWPKKPINQTNSTSNQPTRRIALTNSFGFGGTNGSLVISNFINS
ncbi:3-oxoacyl-[acyl-carrier-protein] synthase, mitochondrial-like [Panonychus citri]|uniref:3-oxoacyl-[acyl-carrier-protein] synthase, mitochondrial-like n=1 Tax=Panonychus citri TaxID=50023 RepID=UPI002306E13C|nr:3-oxoacyl-[acyl-carrier-protein] synthase, mitochondrial-like [Panonychus citri]